MNLEQERASLIALAGQGQPYEFLYRVLPYLAQLPEDTALRLQAVGHFARLGLAGPAMELVDDAADQIPADPELHRSLGLLRRQPSGQVSWQGLRDTFERNLEAACRRFARCRELEAEIRDGVTGLDLHRANDGELLLSRRDGNGPRRWLPAIANWGAQAKDLRLVPEDPNTLCLPYMIEGIGFGHVLRTVYDGTRRMFLTYTPLIHLLEPNVSQLAVALHLMDLTDVLTDERFLLWLGLNGADDFIAYHRAHPTQIQPENVIRQPGWGPSAKACGMSGVELLSREAGERLAQRRAHLDATLADLAGADHYAKRFAERGEAPLRILGITSRYTTFLQYSMRDIREAARRQGHTFRLLIEEHDHTPMLPRDHVVGAIDEFNPDLILIIDHNRKEYDWLHDIQIPYCNWVQDDLPNLFGPGCGEGLHPWDLVVGTIGNFRAASSGYPRDQWANLPVPVSAVTFTDEPVDDADRRSRECDVCFVTHRNVTPDGLLAEALARIPAERPDVRRVIQAQYEQMPAEIAAGRIPGSAPQAIGRTMQLAQQLGLEISVGDADTVRQIFTDRLVNLLFREQVLEWASDMGLDVHIYGRGWEEHPHLAKHARGTAKHGYELRCIYQASRINIQAVATGAIHQRLMEGLFSGGFFALRRTPTDIAGPLNDRVMARAIELGLHTEDEIWSTDDAELARDVRALNDLLYAPMRLYTGFVDDLHVGAERGFSTQAGSLLPRYDEISFSTREEFEQVARRFLADEDARREIVAAQRDVVTSIFSYDAILERVLSFAAQRFADLASASAAVEVSA